MTSHSRAYLLPLLALFFLFPVGTRAATLGLSPASISVAVGDTVTETIFVSSPDQALNAISGELSFPPDLLEVVAVSRGNSVLSLWVQNPSFSNAAGSVTWSGIVPNPGYMGDDRAVLSISFRAKAPGTATVSFASSAVLANDGNGTNILTATHQALIAIGAESGAPSALSARQNVSAVAASGGGAAHLTSSLSLGSWYQVTRAVFTWTNAPGVSAVRLGLDQNPDGTPTVFYAEPLARKEIDIPTGTWYFHMQGRTPDGWGPVYTAMVTAEEGTSVPGIIGWALQSPARMLALTVVDYAALGLLVLAVVLGLVFAAQRFLTRFAPYRQFTNTIGTAYDDLRKRFEHLESVVKEEVLLLEQQKLKRDLTRDEERLSARLKKLIDVSNRMGQHGIPAPMEKERIITRLEENSGAAKITAGEETAEHLSLKEKEQIVARFKEDFK